MSFCIKFRMSERKVKCSKCGMLFKSTEVRTTTTTQIFNCERFEPRSYFKSRLSLIVRVNVVLNGTIVVDSDLVRLVSGEQIAEAETKSLSTTTVLFRTTFTRAIKLKLHFKFLNQVIFLFSFTVGPRLTEVPERFLVITEEAVASLTCEAFGYPPSVITWTRSLGSLPRRRSSIRNGTLTIRDFYIADTGTYVCTASNKLGSVSVATTLGFQRKIGGN